MINQQLQEAAKAYAKGDMSEFPYGEGTVSYAMRRLAYLAGAAHMQAQSAGVWVSGKVLPNKMLNRHPVISEGGHDLGWYDSDLKRWRDGDGDIITVIKWLDEARATL